MSSLLKKVDLKDLKRNAGSIKKAVSNGAKLTKQNSKEVLGKGTELLNNNQEEIEKTASLACPGAGLAVKAVIGGLNAVNNVTNK